LVEETGLPRRTPTTCRKSLTNFITKCCIDYTSPWQDLRQSICSKFISH
jgi:hypothetical protein